MKLIQISVFVFVLITSGQCGDTEQKIKKYFNSPMNQLSPVHYGTIFNYIHGPGEENDYSFLEVKTSTDNSIPVPTSKRDFVPIHEPQQEDTPPTPRPVLPSSQIIAKVAQYQTYIPLNIKPQYTALQRSKVVVSIPQTPSSDIEAFSSQYPFYEPYNQRTPKIFTHIPEGRKQLDYFGLPLSEEDQVTQPIQDEYRSRIYNGHGGFPGYPSQFSFETELNGKVPTGYSFQSGFAPVKSYGPTVSGTPRGSRTGKSLFVDVNHYGYPAKSNNDQLTYF